MTQPPADFGHGHFNLGNGQQLQVKINGQTPENFARNKASGMIWGWIIGLIILAIVVLGGVGFGIYIYFQAKSSMTTAGVSTVSKWDGKSPFTCGGNEAVALVGVTATAGMTIGGNCKVTMVNVNITAPIGVAVGGNGGLTMTGGSITSSSEAVNATGNATVVFANTKISGSVQKKGNATIVGAP